jgi:Fe-S-cluster-containing dehydrogenase component
MDELRASSKNHAAAQAGIQPSKVPAEPLPLEPRGSGARNPRRQFIRRSLAAAGALATAGIWHAPASAAEANPPAPNLYPEAFADGNQLERMRMELLRALEKKPGERKWVMLIDQQKCVGCSSCTISCCAENNLPPGVVYRPVPKRQVGSFPTVNWVFTPRPCMHCDNPPCVPVCPVGATRKEPDGAVVIDYDICIGCRNCLAACPYNARTADFGEFYGHDTPEIMPYETRPNFEYSRQWQRNPEKESSPIGNARKCHFCLHRVKAGMLPACVTTCLGGATYFGDAKDSTGLVHQLMGSNRVRRLKEELGTRPSVYYLV